MAERIQRKRTKGWRMPENCVYVDPGYETIGVHETIGFRRVV